MPDAMPAPQTKPTLVQRLWRIPFWLATKLGRPFGGLRPRRIYHALARRAYPHESYRWVRTAHGATMRLSPHAHIDRHIICFGAYDWPLHRFIDRSIKQGSICLDVGANIGEVTLHMANKAGPSGHVHAFEPLPSILTRLRENVARNQLDESVTCHGIALSDANGSIEIAAASLDAPNQGQASLVSRRAELERTFSIEGRRFDDVARELGLDRVDWIKVDIQGAEPMFLDGCGDVLGRLGAKLLVELEPEDLAATGRTNADLVAQIESLGFEIHDLDDDGNVGARISTANVATDRAYTNVVCLPVA